MKKDDLIRNLKAELLKIERQNKIYATGETRYDLMIEDVLDYIENSIPNKKIENNIKELETKNYTRIEYNYRKLIYQELLENK